MEHRRKASSSSAPGASAVVLALLLPPSPSWIHPWHGAGRFGGRRTVGYLPGLLKACFNVNDHLQL
jgi:uncharacterized membrane protein YqaE (UPF0057 family)